MSVPIPGQVVDSLTGAESRILSDVMMMMVVAEEEGVVQPSLRTFVLCTGDKDDDDDELDILKSPIHCRSLRLCE